MWINAVFVPLWTQVKGLSNRREGKCGFLCLCPLQAYMSLENFSKKGSYGEPPPPTVFFFLSDYNEIWDIGS